MASSALKQCAFTYTCIQKQFLLNTSSKISASHFKLQRYQQTIANSRLNSTRASVETLKTNDEVNSELKANHENQNYKFNEKSRKQRKTWRESEKSITASFQDSDPDSFGTLSKQKTKNLVLEKILDELPEEEGDRIEQNYVPGTQRKRLRLKEYEAKIRKLLEEKRVGDAIDVLEVQMLKEDRAEPSYQIYNLLIKGCGHAGYTKKAFNLFNSMKKRGLRPTSGSYTSLFNSCANCPYPKYGLERATYLKNLMDERSIYIEPLTYHAAIKAFGRCGAIDVAFSLVDEMIEKRMPLTQETFSYILQGCISDKEAGFRHALMVWHKLRRKWITPNVYNYNLFLRTVRDCGTGNLLSFQEAIKNITEKGVTSPQEYKLRIEGNSADAKQNSNVITIKGDETNVAQLTAPETSVDQPQFANATESTAPETSSDESLITNFVESTSHQISSDQTQFTDRVADSDISENDSQDVVENRPSLLAYRPHLGNIVNLEEITTSQDRLILIGGVNGVLKEMENDGVKPTISTFGLLLSIIPNTLSAEKVLLSIMKKYDVEFSIDFFNILMKKRSMRFDYHNAKNVLRLLQEHHLEPDIITFGTLALSCKKKGEAQEMLQFMEGCGFRPNIEILGAMMRHACCQYSFGYIVYLMKYVQEEELEVNEMFLHHLTEFYYRCIDTFRRLHQLEKKDQKNPSDEEINIPDFFKDKMFQESFSMFQNYYRSWLKTAKVEPKLHPWAEVRKKGSSRTEKEDEALHHQSK